jgi:hypothetical protein
MTFARALVKPLVPGTNPLVHPILAFRALKATFNAGHGLFGEECYNRYAVFHDANEFAKSNNFSKKERKQLLKALNSGVIEFMNVGSLKSPKSCFLMTKLEGNTVTGFVIRTNSSKEFPERVDNSPRTFTFDGGPLSFSSEPQNCLDKAFGSTGLDEKKKFKYWTAIISGVAIGMINNPTSELRFKKIFVQPCFG